MNDVIWNVVVVVCVCLYGFLLGSIPNGVIIGKIFFGDDPRNYGSHNSGGTNSGRAFGKKAGIAVIVLDILKAVLAFWSVWAVLRFSGIRQNVSLWDDGVFYNYLTLLFVSLGHCFSPWIHFKGGKAVACFMGSTGGQGFLNFALCVTCFTALFKKKRVMSVATIFSSIIISALQWVLFLIRNFLPNNGQRIMDYFMFNLGYGGGSFYGWECALISTLIMFVLIIRHSSNIKRLKDGTEKPVEWK